MGNSQYRECKDLLLTLSLVQEAHGFESHRAHDRQALGAELVESVLRGVMEDVVVAVVKVD